MEAPLEGSIIGSMHSPITDGASTVVLVRFY